MFDFHDKDNEPVSEINLTPLIDVTMVLLIIFMIVSSFVTKQTIKIELPKAASSSEAKIKNISIVVSSEGNYFLSGKKIVSLEELKSKIRDAKQKNPDIQVIIAGDKKVRYGKIVTVIDLLRKEQIYNFSINVEFQEKDNK